MTGLNCFSWLVSTLVYTITSLTASRVVYILTLLTSGRKMRSAM